MTPKLQMLQRTVQKLIRRGERHALVRVIERSRPADLGHMLGHFFEGERSQLLDACPNDEIRAEILGSTETSVASRIIGLWPPERAVELLRRLEPDDVSDILENLPEQQAAELLKGMRVADRDEVEDLARYESHTAGGIMSPRFFALHRDTKASAAIEQLQRVSDELEMAFYIYVVNEVEQLLGVVSLRQLVTTRPDTTLFELMTSDVISVTPEEDQEEVAKLASRYGLLAIPVVNEANKLIGIVTVDDVLDVLREEAAEDMLRMGGAGGEFFEQRGLFRSVAQRFPWLVVAACGGTLGAWLLFGQAQNSSTLLLLALFVPLVFTLSGTTALQAATLVAQNIARGVFGVSLVLHVLRQVGSSAILGALFGIIAYALLGFVLPAAGLHFGVDYEPSALRVSLSIAASMATAGLIGGTLPALFLRIRVDPAMAAGPIGAVGAEVLALAVYLTLGTAGM